MAEEETLFCLYVLFLQTKQFHFFYSIPSTEKFLVTTIVFSMVLSIDNEVVFSLGHPSCKHKTPHEGRNYPHFAHGRIGERRRKEEKG
jgi:hypothetical protein